MCPDPGFRNPYSPGAGHMPPHLAGREDQILEFDRLLEQEKILDNLVLTGLRGVGKTVLLERLKPRAIRAGWLWVGADLSESASVSEVSLARRLLTDLSVATSAFSTELKTEQRVGFTTKTAETTQASVSFKVLTTIYDETPGLVADKIKRVLEFVHAVLGQHGRGKIVFAYDEAQNLSDHSDQNEFPLSVLLDVFQSIQRKGIPFMLVLTGLPTLFPKLVDARTFAERMFRVVTLDRLTRDASRDAIIKPLDEERCPVRFTDDSVETICDTSAGYPYFIQFICREVFDIAIQQLTEGDDVDVPVEAIQQKLDTDFFAGRWARVTDRQRHLLWIVASLEKDGEFTIQEVVEQSRQMPGKAFSPSHVSQMLAALGEQGLIYRNRFGKYSFAVPLLGEFILRVHERPI